jgi:hypothetical protein
LHQQWLKTLNIKELSDQFYLKIEAIFKDNLKNVDIPDTDEIKQDFLLKFFGRLIFCWFLRAKGWVDADILSLIFLKDKHPRLRQRPFYKLLSSSFRTTIFRFAKSRRFYKPASK